MVTYPDDPWLFRVMADFLKHNKSFIEAEKNYKESYRIFMEQGRSPQAIAALLRSWTIVRPTAHDFRALHASLRRKDSHSSALAECFAKMSYQELTSVLKCISLAKYPAKQVLRKAGENESTLFFVVYGNLISSAPDDNGPQGDSARILKENDFFGDRHPYSEEKTVSNLVKSLTEVELIQISKTNLLTLCGEHPDLQIGLKNLLEDNVQYEEDHPAKFYRKSSRRKLSITLFLDILDREPGKHPITVKCYTSDMSLGGVCVFVDPRYRDLPGDLVNRRAKLRISLPDESISLTILGRLAWHKEADMDGEDTYAIGIQFNETPPRLRGLLIVFANAVGSMTRQMTDRGADLDD